MTDTGNTLPEILVISSADSDQLRQYNDAFVQKLNERSGGVYQASWSNYHDIGLRIGSGGVDAFLVSSGRLLSTFKTVYFKSYFKCFEQAAAIADALDLAGVKFIGRELRESIPMFKLSQMSRLARRQMPVPETLYLPMEHFASHFDRVVEELGLPFIFKAIDAKTGDDNYLVKDWEMFENLTQQYADRHFIAQRFIPNDGDIRVLIVDYKIRLIIERRRTGDTHLNNTSKGAVPRLVTVSEFPDELQGVAIGAARSMGRDIAGVDLMLETGTEKPFILEVNASPQIATGAFEQEKLELYANYFKELVQ